MKLSYRDHSAALSLRRDRASVPTARRFVRRTLQHKDDELVDVVELLVSEVVTNAIQHANSPCRLTVKLLSDGGVRVEVHDIDTDVEGFDSGRPGRQDRCDDSAGRGLLILETLAHRWGYEPLAGRGKRVWFHVRPPARP